MRKKGAQELRRARFRGVNPLPRTAQTESQWRIKISELDLKYSGQLLKDMDQRSMYWLSVDQLVPRPSPFRDKWTDTYGIDWKWTDSLKLFTESRMQAFQWRSSHGKLYGRSDLDRFNYVGDSVCHLCNAPKQNIEHIYLQCPRIQLLFKNFERHLKLDTPISDCEKIIGADKNKERSKLTNKKLGVLRKCVYDSVHAQVTLKWEQVLKSIDNLYIIEYSIGEKNGRVHKVLKEWDL
jgi:hypothetical protein